jgi:hypothetical protein
MSVSDDHYAAYPRPDGYRVQTPMPGTVPTPYGHADGSGLLRQPPATTVPVRSQATNTALEMGKLGAIVGLCGAAANELHKLKDGRTTGSAAALETLRTAAASGIATAGATLVAAQFRSSITGLAATLVTGTAVMYALNAERAAAEPTPAPVAEP